MGVALAAADNIDIARKRAKECAAKVRPRTIA
jgi:formate-dependent phosphoribosylglycinamide formyltransferase (GAR transformylase)